MKDERSRIKQEQKEVHLNYEGEDWNTLYPDLGPSLLG